MQVVDGVGGSSFTLVHVTDARLQRSEGKWDLRSWKQQMLTHTSSPLTLKVRSELCGADSFLFHGCVFIMKNEQNQSMFTC